MEHGMAFHLQLLGVHFIFHKQAKHGCCRNVFLHSLLTLRCACLHQSPRCVVSQGKRFKTICVHILGQSPQIFWHYCGVGVIFDTRPHCEQLLMNATISHNPAWF